MVRSPESFRETGFEPCEAFEPYSSMPAQAISTSLFFEKRLFPRTLISVSSLRLPERIVERLLGGAQLAALV